MSGNFSEDISANLVVNSSLNESGNFSFLALKSEVVNDILLNNSLVELWFSFFLMAGIVFLCFMIFKESRKINSFIGIRNLGAFSKSFLFYFFMFVAIFLMDGIIILNYYFDIFLNFNFWGFLFLFLAFFLFAWMARSFLLFSILLKFYEKKFVSKESNLLFLFWNFCVIFFEFIFSSILLIVSEYVFIFYNFVLIILFLVLIYRKSKIKNIFKQVPQITIILLLFLRFTSSFSYFFDSDDLIFYFDYGIDILTFLIYLYIYFKLLCWRKKFEK